MYPDTSWYFLIRLYTSWYFSFLLGTSWNSLILPDTVRNLLTLLKLQEGDRFLQTANACRFWPTGRGIFHNTAKVGPQKMATRNQSNPHPMHSYGEHNKDLVWITTKLWAVSQKKEISKEVIEKEGFFQGLLVRLLAIWAKHRKCISKWLFHATYKHDYLSLSGLCCVLQLESPSKHHWHTAMIFLIMTCY